MVLLAKKMDFVDYIIRTDNIIRDDIVYDFFKALSQDSFLLQRIKFTMGIVKVNYDYKIMINMRNKVTLCEVRGRLYKEPRMLKAILRALKDNQKATVCVIIKDNKHTIRSRFKDVCEHLNMVTDLINSAIVDYVLRDVRRITIIKEIEKTLEDNDKEKFIKLTEELKELTER